METSKLIVGLDLGSNSIGWAVVKAANDGVGEAAVRPVAILAAGSRIVPMDSQMLSNFEKGNSVSQTATRRAFRSMRRMAERKKLRRARLFRVMRMIGWLPGHMAEVVDAYGNIKCGLEPKIEWNNGVFLFQKSFDEMCAEFGGTKVSHDWTVYYLRKKALREAISGQEMAWVLMNFNQKRGYKASRTDIVENDEKEGQSKEVVDVCVTNVVREGKKLILTFDDGGTIEQKSDVDSISGWVGKRLELLKTTVVSKKGETTVKYSQPGEDDWTLKKTKTENDIKSKAQTVGEYIYANLLSHPDEKLRGGKLTVVDRSMYKDELERILKCQKQFHPELDNQQLLEDCAAALYPNNPARRKEAMRNGLVGLIMDDIIHYQRPLKSKKSSIADCPLETRTYVDFDGQLRVKKIKCVPRSHPLFQEFRLWQTVNNLRVTNEENEDILTDNLREVLFDELTRKKDVNEKGIKAILKKKRVNVDGLKVNIVEGKSLPCYETRNSLVNCLKKAGLKEDEALALLARQGCKDMTNEEMLWHMSYSVVDRNEFEKAVGKWADKNGLDKKATVEAFLKIKPTSDYASYSLKAIKRFLPLMRLGSKWKWECIDDKTRSRITHILTAEEDDALTDDVRKAFSPENAFVAEHDFQGLQPWQVSMLVYGKLTGAEKANWESADDVVQWVKSFRNGSLRNPVVEQVVLETMRVVADVWRKYGKIDEIHLEMARELKKTNAERKKMTNDNTIREKENECIRTLLRKLAMTCEGVNPFSPIQQTKLKICIEGARANSVTEPNVDEVEKYGLWIEQNYRSPYTGNHIKLSRLFTSDYEIEHVIPRSRYYDDSFNNKVICEAAVNKDKGNMMGMEYIKAAQGRCVETGGGNRVTVISEAGYVQLVNEMYKNNVRKRDNLLRTELPSGFNNRQMNDSRYISVLVKALLSNIVREPVDDDGECSKNIVVCTGAVTDKLKQDWGVNDKWNEVILPRFEELDKMNGYPQDPNMRYVTECNGHKIPSVPTDMLKGFNKKRIDHRHHAMDAIVIACANRAMVQYFANEAAGNQPVFDALKLSVCRKDPQHGWVVKMPWVGFPDDVRRTLEGITASFKQRPRIVTKTTNRYTKIVNGKRESVKQSTYAIRKSLHKDTVWGEVKLCRRTESLVELSVAVKAMREYLDQREADPKAQPTMKIADNDLRKEVRVQIADGWDDKEITKFFKEKKDGNKVKVWTFGNGKRVFATRFLSNLADIFGKLTDEAKIKDKIAEITDTGIQKILLNHLQMWPGGCDTAFSAEGLQWLNENISALNDGKRHKPILKVRRTEASEAKQPIGEAGNKNLKFVEADKGTNLFFAVYSDGNGGRAFATIPLRNAIDRRLQGRSIVPEVDEKGNKLLFSLSPMDLVYVPVHGETSIEDKNRIYRLVSSRGRQAFFIPANVAKVIADKKEFNSSNKIEYIGGLSIKSVCLPLNVDRLGNVTLKHIEGDD